VTVAPLTRLGVPRSSVARTGDTADGYRVVSARARHLHRPLSFLELSLVLAVVGVAAAIAIPDYLQMQRDANTDSAKARLGDAARTLESRYVSTGTFAGAALPSGVRLHAAGGSYCIETTADGHVWHAVRHGRPASGAC